MTLLFMDGFDHYATFTDKWTTVDSMTINSSAKRFTTGFGARSSLQQGNIRKTLPSSYTTLIAGFAFKPTSGFAGLGVASYNAGATSYCRLRMDSNGQLFIQNGSGTTIGSASAATQLLPGWNFIEWKVTFNTSTGSAVVKLNGTTIFNLSSVNTTGTTVSIDSVMIGPAFGGATSHIQDYDDFWVCDTSGSVNNDFLGDSRVYTLYPSGNGNYSQFTRTGGSASGNYTAVQEAQHDSDTSYVSSATPNQIDSYAFDDLPATVATVKAVQFSHVARKDDAGTRTIAPFMRNGSTDSVGTTSGDLPSSYAVVRTIHETSLQTASAWTVSEINASEFGTKLIS